jgi:multimeric flavodoxin WrbA/putative sterol carrier protein
MKQEITALKCLETYSRYIIGAYNNAENKEKGTIQFFFHHNEDSINCYFTADGQKMEFYFGETGMYDVQVKTTLYDWLDLGNGKLNPFFGVLTKKIRFNGNVNVLYALINRDLIFKIKADISDPPAQFEKHPVRKWLPPRKILVLNGSPRSREGYTFHYLNRFVKGLENSEASIEMIDLGKKNIKPCVGCFHCWKNNTGRCIQKDDVNYIYDMYNDADLIIYAFTIYWDTVPGILKNFIERAFCLEHPYMIQGLTKTRHPRRVKMDKAFFLFSVCGFPEQENFDSVKEYFKKVSHNAHMPFLGGIYRTSCMLLPNDPNYFKMYNNVLDSMQKAGESLIRTGNIDKKILRTIHTKISPKEFQIHANKFWENVLLKDEYFVKSV